MEVDAHGCWFCSWYAGMIKLFFGKPGEGKSAEVVARVFDEYEKEGRTVYSNIPLAFPFTPITSLSDLLGVRDGVVVLDEVQRYVAAEEWQTIPSELRLKLQEHRHHGLDIYGMTQHPSFIAPSMRRLVGEWWQVKKMIGSGQKAKRVWGVIMSSRVILLRMADDEPIVERLGIMPEYRLLTREVVDRYDSYGDTIPWVEKDVIEEVTRYRICPGCGTKRKVL